MADLKDVVGKEEEWRDLFQRMDDDRDLYYLNQKPFVDRDGNPLTGTLKVTLNHPATFAAHVQSSIMAATQQVQVKGQGLNDDQTAPVEEFINAAFQEADRLLLQRGESPLKPFLVEQLNIRGRGAARILVRRQDGEYVPEVMPVDGRSLLYEMGPKGLVWAAHRTLRSPGAVRMEYGAAANIPENHTRPVIVTDLWDGESNKIYIQTSPNAGQRQNASAIPVRDQPNPYGYPPFAIQRVPLGSMLREAEALKRQGESIFFLIRDIVPQVNLWASIMQTINLESLKPPLTWHSREGQTGQVPENVDEPGAITGADTDGGAKLVPMRDLTQAGRMMWEVLNNALQQGSLSSTDFGNSNFPMSAVALIELGEASGQVFLPRLGALGLLYQQIAEMVIRQTLALNVGRVEMGAVGRRQTYPTAPLKAAYDIQYLYTPKDPATDVARLQMGEVAERFYSRKTVLEQVLKDENPTRTMDEKLAEEADELSPAVRMYRTTLALIRQGRTLEAEIMADELGLTIEQIMAGNTTPTTRAEPQPARNMFGELNPASRSASNSRATRLQGKVADGTGDN